MEFITYNSSKQQLISATETNLVEYWLFQSHSPEVEIIKTSNILLLNTTVQDIFYNGVIQTHLDADLLPQQIIETIRHFDLKKLPFTWWITPSTKPDNLALFLIKYGLKHFESYPGMIMDLSILDSKHSVIDKYKVLRVENLSMLNNWMSAFNLGFDSSPQVDQKLYKIYADLGFSQASPLQHYVGFLQDKPVSTSSMFLGGGVAGIWSVSTIPEARGLGWGTAITLRALFDAREMGVKTAVLFSSKQGFEVYRKLGFISIFEISHFHREI